MSNVLANQIDEINTRFFKLSLRERGLIVIAGLALVLLGGYVTFIEPQLKLAKMSQREAGSGQVALAELDQQIASLEQDLKADPNIPLRQRLSELTSQIASLDLKLDSHTQDLVPADKMPQLLERVLSKSDKLKLVILESIAPIQLLKADEQQNNQSKINLYQHGVRLVLEGSYFDIQGYLEQLETLPWRFYWRVFSYDVKEYPVAQVELELYTLSTSEAFIGVATND